MQVELSDLTHQRSDGIPNVGLVALFQGATGNARSVFVDLSLSIATCITSACLPRSPDFDFSKTTDLDHGMQGLCREFLMQ